ncbi:MAG: phytanoyl-CoA dioxygenase family protein [Bacteroidia bacterium]|nr:phytanoyl-CoA dioxygenase family protein [Bacteroidia bacterium]
MTQRQQLDQLGFTILNDIFSNKEIENILNALKSADTSKATFRKTEDLFAIRQFLKEVPAISKLVFTDKFNAAIKMLLGENYFVVKSIYFDKPEKSNWFVSYHQDLTISVDKKMEIENYGPWTVKQNQFAVQPPLDILKSIYTIRIHLDNTDAENGALKVVPGSHLNGIYRPETIDWTKEKETICCVPKGGIMLMRPLLLHSSGRTNNNKRRRVIHIELSNADLAHGLNWSEKSEIEQY